MFGSDCGLTFTEIPDTMRNVDLGLGAAVPFPADDVGRVALPPAEARRNDSDMCIADIHTEGFQCSLASAAYVEDYNFDVLEGIDLMVHCRSRIRDGSEAQQGDHTDMVPVCQMVSCVTRNGWDVFEDDSLAEAAVVDGPNMDDYYHRVVSSDEEDFHISDIGSI